MAYSLIGETFHEAAGTAVFALFIAHHAANRKWYGALFKGKFTAARVFRTVLNVLLLIVMILQPISGILLSRHLFAFLPSLPVSAQARSIHLLLAYWGCVLMCVHAGTHLTAPFGRLAQKTKKRSRRYTGCLDAFPFTAVRRGFPGYMSGGTTFAFFDYGEPLARFLLDYLAVMVLFMTTGYLIVTGLNKKKTAERTAVRDTDPPETPD